MPLPSGGPAGRSAPQRRFPQILDGLVALWFPAAEAASAVEEDPEG